MSTVNTDIMKVAYPPELKIVAEAARERVLAARKAQDYYDGHFWRYLDTPKAVLQAHNQALDYPTGVKKLDYEKTQIELQYPKFFIDELASWMFENPVKIQGDDPELDEVLKVHKANKLDGKLMQAAQESCLTGGVVFKVLWNEATKSLRVYPRPSRECFPVMNPDDVDILEKVSFVALQDDEEHVWKQTFELRYMYGIPVCWVTEAIYTLKSIKNSADPTPEKILYDNPLYMGEKFIDFLPATIIPNEPNLGDVWGKSDLDPLYDPINEICKKYSSFADFLEFEMFPITIFKNVDWSKTNKPKIAPGATANLKGGDSEHPVDVFKLEASMSSKDAVEWFVNQLIDHLHQFSGVPRITRDTSAIQSSMSGYAVKLQYLSIISATNRKLTYWNDGLTQIYDQILRSKAVYEGFNYREDYDIRIEQQSKLPENEREELDLLADKVGMLVMKTTDAMAKLGVPDPDIYLAELLRERSEIDAATEPDVYGAAIRKEAEEE